MPRRGTAKQREIPPDQVFGSILVTRIINKIMMQGKKSVAERTFYGMIEIVADRSEREPLEVLTEALNNIMPLVEVRARRVGGSTYQVPMEVRPSRRLSLGIRWLLDAARKRSERNIVDCLANEVLEAAKSEGGAVARKEEVQRMAEAGRAFAHYKF